MLRSIRRAWPSSSSIMMMVTGLVMTALFRLLAVHWIGSVIVNVLPLVKFRGDRHGSAEPPDQCADVRQANALAGLVLGSGAAEQFENALVVLGIDAAAVIDDLEDRKTELGPARGPGYRRERRA